MPKHAHRRSVPPVPATRRSRTSASPGRHRARSAAPAVSTVAVAGAVTAAMLVGVGPMSAAASPAAAAHRSRPAAPTAVAAGAGTPSRLSSLLMPSGSRIVVGSAGSAAKAASRSVRRPPLHKPAVHRWVLPARGPLSSPYGWRWGRLHAGIDLAAPYGAPIVAATDGCITYAGPMGGYGEVLMLRDWDGTETVYGHMSSFVRQSGCVHAGDELAHVGAEGDATGPHLHFEVRINGATIDPFPFLRQRGVQV